jgi:hypothetical protein
MFYVIINFEAEDKQISTQKEKLEMYHDLKDFQNDFITNKEEFQGLFSAFKRRMNSLPNNQMEILNFYKL